LLRFRRWDKGKTPSFRQGLRQIQDIERKTRFSTDYNSVAGQKGAEKEARNRRIMQAISDYQRRFKTRSARRREGS